MSIKMIVTDLDGTLLRADKTVSKYTESIFEKYRSRGIKVVFATARPKRAVKDLKLGIKSDACIYHNGAVIEIKGKLLQKFGIEPIILERIIEDAMKNSITQIAVEIDDVLFTNFNASTFWPGVEYTLTDLKKIPRIHADKVIFITNDKAKIDPFLSDSIYSEISENEIVMVMNKDARKKKAVDVLAFKFGVSLLETVAFGDDFNDIEMLKECGVGVAVENAIEQVKIVADYICDLNDSDGVAKWLEEYLK